MTKNSTPVPTTDATAATATSVMSESTPTIRSATTAVHPAAHPASVLPDR